MIGRIGPGTGITGLDLFVAQSGENVQSFNEVFQEALNRGFETASAADEALRILHLTKYDFTSSDWQRVTRHVENAAASRSSHNG
ncbi:MAG: hypothetical protein J6T34_00250 [Bacilli bacterium]|nr:hypothetical protein [Bacilli bacterium]